MSNVVGNRSVVFCSNLMLVHVSCTRNFKLEFTSYKLHVLLIIVEVSKTEFDLD